MALPYVDPGAPRGRLHRAYVRLVGSRVAGWFSRLVVLRLGPFLLRATGGRFGLGVGLPTALLETRGARTGHPRRNGVIYFHDGDSVIIIASKLGPAEHRGWSHTAGPHPEVVRGGEPFRAQIVEDEA